MDPDPGGPTTYKYRAATLLFTCQDEIRVKTGASWSNLEMVERQMVEAVGTGGKRAAAQRADNCVFRLKIQKI
jgi:hypothetical protein